MNMSMMEGMTAGGSASSVYTGTDPWYLRTLPGRSGDFMGHFIPGICYGGLGLGLLLLALYRAQNLPPGKSFASLHIPESDPRFLKWFGIACMAGTALGTLYEMLDKDPGYDSVAFTHTTLYASYFIMGVCAVYESKGRLPLDTHRTALVIACVTQALIWHAHGSMKQLPEDGALHILLSYINLANAATVAYSVRFTDSVIAFLAGWALLVLQGVWIILSGLYECCVDLHVHDIAMLLASFSLLIFLGILLVAAHFGPSLSDQDVAKYRGKFSALGSGTMDSDSDDEHML